MKLYQLLAQSVGAMHRCKASGNSEWRNIHSERIETLVSRHFPIGSGFDVGTGIDLDASTEEKTRSPHFIPPYERWWNV